MAAELLRSCPNRIAPPVRTLCSCHCYLLSFGYGGKSSRISRSEPYTKQLATIKNTLLMKNKVKFYREKNNLTQTELAEKSGLSLRTIQRIENGNTPKGFTLKSLAEALEIDTENLLNKKIELDKIKIINISVLSFFIVPFGNIILPTILTFNSKNEKTKSLGKEIVSFQIIWTVITSILLIISPFIQRWLSISIPLIFILLIPLICINVFIVFKNSISLEHKNKLYISPKIKLL